MSDNPKTGHYRVDYEYAKLREAVLGGTQVMLPHKGTIFDKYITDLFPDEETREFLRAMQGTPMSEAHPEDHQRMVGETNALAAVFEKYGVIVYHAEPYTEETLRLLGRGGYNNGWAKDAFESVGEYHFDLAHKKHMYRYFNTTVRNLLQRAFKEDSKMKYLSFPQPFPTDVDEGYGPGPFFEGGDTMVLPGKKVLTGESGQASDPFGDEIFKRLLEDAGYELIHTRLHPNMLHLDCCVSIIGPDTILYAPETFLDGLPEVLADVPNKVETTLLEAQRLLNNPVVIDRNTVVVDLGIKGKQGAELEALGKTVEYVDFSIHKLFGGALRCKTGVLSRYDD